MEVLLAIEKEPIPSLAEADDWHTRKVKNWDDLNNESREVIMEQVDDVLEDHGEAMEMNQTLEEEVSFKDKLMRNGCSQNLAQPFCWDWISRSQCEDWHRKWYVHDTIF